jgi:hypothetical protein
VEIYTIGFTQTTAERFFERLADAGVARLLDVRLNNTSQLAGRERHWLQLNGLCLADRPAEDAP